MEPWYGDFRISARLLSFKQNSNKMDKITNLMLLLSLLSRFKSQKWLRTQSRKKLFFKFLTLKSKVQSETTWNMLNLDLESSLTPSLNRLISSLYNSEEDSSWLSVRLLIAYWCKLMFAAKSVENRIFYRNLIDWINNLLTVFYKELLFWQDMESLELTKLRKSTMILTLNQHFSVTRKQEKLLMLRIIRNHMV